MAGQYSITALSEWPRSTARLIVLCSAGFCVTAVVETPPLLHHFPFPFIPLNLFSLPFRKKNGHYTAVPVKSGSPMVERRFWLRVHRYEHGAFAGAGSAYWDLARGQCGAVHGAAHLCCDDPAARIRRTEPVDSRGDSPYVTSTLRFPSVTVFIHSALSPVLLNMLGAFETGECAVSRSKTEF